MNADLFRRPLRAAGLVASGVLWLLGLLAAPVASADTQVIRLDAGWNLITFQVVPSNPAPAAVFGSLGTTFERAFAYDNAGRTWTAFARPAASDANQAAPMPPVATARAYWVYMNAAVPAWSVGGIAPAITPAVDLVSGWNLVGIPTGAGQLSEPVDMPAVLAAAGLDYDVLLRWEQNLYTKFTPTDADFDDFTTFDPNRGYWVNVKNASFSLQPRLLVSVRADVDVEPQGNYPSYEDLKLSPSPVPLSANDQTHLVFLEGEDAQTLAIGNVGGGILLWELSTTNAPWLLLSATRGVTTIENDVVTLALDRRLLPRGRYTASLKLRTSAGDRDFVVVANVPGVSGEWRGQAVIATANGRANPLPEIDLHVSFFEDPAIDGLLRGLIDSQNALLWPVDVPLAGHTGGGNGNGFRLQGGFILPPGDVNQAPFYLFDPMLDIDWNCNGRLDAINPYPFPIYRAVTLNGELVVGNGRDGYEIRGDYSEVIHGMLREPIRLEGTFTLRRANLAPFSERRPVANSEPANGDLPVVLRQFTPPVPLNVPPGRTTNSLDVVTDLVLQSVGVDLDLADAPPVDLRVTLIAPGGQSVVLHDRADIASLRNLSLPSQRATRDSFSRLTTNSVSTRGRWRLVVENNGGTLGRLFSWSLRLAGQPVFSLSGRVTSNGSGVPAQVFVDGLPFTETTLADANGNFTFNRLPGLPLNFSASLKGYEAADPARPGLGDAFTVPQFSIDCASPAKLAAMGKFRALPATAFPPTSTDGFATNGGTAGNPYRIALAPEPGVPTMLLAAPEFGFAPLPATLCLLPASAGVTNRWTYGDGAPVDTTTASVREHVYVQPRATGYVAQVETRVEGQPVTLQTRVYPLPSPGNTPYAVNVFLMNFTGGGAIPENLGASILGTNNPAGPAQLATLLTVQHAYCASFDIDLAPRGVVGQSFYADGFDPGNTLVNTANRLSGFRDEDYNYQVGNGNDPGQWSLAADCGWVLADDFLNAHPRPGQLGDCAAPRYLMLCNIGMTILPSSADEVFPVTPAPLPVAASDPHTRTEASGVAGNRALKLITGPLAPYWK